MRAGAVALARRGDRVARSRRCASASWPGGCCGSRRRPAPAGSAHRVDAVDAADPDVRRHVREVARPQPAAPRAQRPASVARGAAPEGADGGAWRRWRAAHSGAARRVAQRRRRTGRRTARTSTRWPRSCRCRAAAACGRARAGRRSAASWRCRSAPSPGCANRRPHCPGPAGQEQRIVDADAGHQQQRGEVEEGQACAERVQHGQRHQHRAGRPAPATRSTRAGSPQPEQQRRQQQATRRAPASPAPRACRR